MLSMDPFEELPASKQSAQRPIWYKNKNQGKIFDVVKVDQDQVSIVSPLVKPRVQVQEEVSMKFGSKPSYGDFDILEKELEMMIGMQAGLPVGDFDDKFYPKEKMNNCSGILTPILNRENSWNNLSS